MTSRPRLSTAGSAGGLGFARLVAAWALLAAACVLVFRAHPGRAVFALVWLGAVAFPALWVAAGGEGQSWNARARQAAGGLLVVAPWVALLRPWSPVTDVVLGTCAVGVGAFWVSVGVYAQGLRRPEQRPAFLACALGLAAGVPLAQRLLREAFGWQPRSWLSAADALREGWAGQAELSDWAAVCVPWLALAGAGWLVRQRRPRVAWVAVTGLALGASAAEELDARLVFGGWARPGEPTPVWVVGQPSGEGATGVKVAEVRALRGPRAGSGPLVGPAAPSDLVRMEVGTAVNGRWEGHALPGALRAVPMGELLIGVLGDEPPAGVLPAGPQVVLQARDVQLIARGGQALDVVWVAPGVLQPSWVIPLASWAACGGTLVLADATDAQRFGLSPIAGARATGSGWVVHPAGSSALSGAAAGALSARLSTRARRQATLDALRGRPPPADAPAATRWLVWVSLAWLSVVLAVARWGALLHLAVATLFALIAIGLGGSQYAGPRVNSAQVLEVSAGGDVASRLELLTLFTPRPQQLNVKLSGSGNPPWVTHESHADAWRTPLSVETSTSGSRVDCRGSTVGTSLARLDAVRLGGAITVTRGSGGNRLKLSNQAQLDLERVYVLFRGTAYRVGELASGRQVEFDLQQTGQRFNRWRLRSLDPREASLIRAVVHGRDLDRQLVVLGWTRGSEPSEIPAAAWVVQEPTLVLVRAVGP